MRTFCSHLSIDEPSSMWEQLILEKCDISSDISGKNINNVHIRDWYLNMQHFHTIVRFTTKSIEDILFGHFALLTNCFTGKIKLELADYQWLKKRVYKSTFKNSWTIWRISRSHSQKLHIFIFSLWVKSVYQYFKIRENLRLDIFQSAEKLM